MFNNTNNNCNQNKPFPFSCNNCFLAGSTGPTGEAAPERIT